MEVQENGFITLQGFVEGIPVSEVLSLLHRMKKNGILRFNFDGGVIKQVYFKNGNVVFATSNIDDDRLGESLVRNGKITMEQLNRAAREITPAKKLGKILVEMGYITAKELFLGVRVQIEEIIQSLFTYSSGYFEFKETNVTDVAASIPINLKNAIIAGLRRAGRVINPENFLTSLDVTLGVREDTFDLDLNDDEKAVLNFAKAKKTVKEILSMKSPALRGALGRLLEAGIIYPGPRVEKRMLEKVDETEETLRNLNSILMDIFAIIKTKSKKSNVYEMLNTFFINLSPRFKDVFAGVELQKDGSINISTILKNLSEKISPDFRQKILMSAMSELLQFELFELRHYLNKEEEQELLELIKEFGFER